MSHDMTDAELAEAMKAMHAPPRVPPKKKLRPRGWNAAVAAERAAMRIAKLEARQAQRGTRSGRVGRLLGFPASLNRRTGQPHEHSRAKARQFRQQRALMMAGRKPWTQYMIERPFGPSIGNDPPARA